MPKIPCSPSFNAISMDMMARIKMVLPARSILQNLAIKVEPFSCLTCRKANEMITAMAPIGVLRKKTQRQVVASSIVPSWKGYRAILMVTAPNMIPVTVPFSPNVRGLTECATMTVQYLHAIFKKCFGGVAFQFKAADLGSPNSVEYVTT